jgi:large subunit ribosomal protein L25
MQTIKLTARMRKEASKKNVHKLRKGGEIPGVLYGHGKDPVHLAIPEHDFWSILHNATSEHLIIELDVSHLMINDTIHVSDLVSLYPAIDFLDDGNINLAHVSPPKKLEIAEELEEGAEEGAEGAAAEGAGGAEGEGAAEGGEEA